jgi:hypothetical protein
MGIKNTKQQRIVDEHMHHEAMMDIWRYIGRARKIGQYQ